MACYTALLMAVWVRREGRLAFQGLLSTALRSGACALPACLGGWWIDRLIRSCLSLHPVSTSLLGLACAGLFFLAVFLPLSARFCPGALDPLLKKLAGRFRRR